MSAPATAKIRTVFAPVLALIRLHWIALCVIGGLLLLYTLAGFFLAPYLARTQLTKYVTQTLHRQVTLGELNFNPFTFVVEARDFKLSEADGAPLVGFRYLRINAGLASIWQRAVSLQEVSLIAPEVDVIIERDATVNLAKLAPTESSEPPRVRIAAFSVSHGRIGIEDRTRAQPFTAQVRPITFSLTDFRTDGGHENAYRFAGTTHEGEQLEWSGGFTVQPLGSRGSFRVDGMKLATPGPYLREALPFRFTSGTATLSGGYTLTAKPFALDVTLPSITLSEVAISELDGEPTNPVSADLIALEQLSFSHTKREVALKQAEITGAQVSVVREPNGNFNLMRLAGTPTSDGAQQTTVTATPTPAATQSSNDWYAHVGQVRLVGARLVGEDRTVEPTVRAELAPLELTVKGWSTRPDTSLDIDLATAVNKSGRVAANGAVQLEPMSAQLAFDVSDIALPFLQPYIAQATAMTLHSGKVGAKGNVSLRTSAEAPSIDFTGELRVADLRTTDDALDADFIKWRNLAITGIDLGRNPDRLTIDRIVAREPYANVIIAQDTTLNVASVLRLPNEDCPESGEGCEPATQPEKKPAKKSEPQPATQRATPIRIRTVQVANGSANFADYSIAPSFAAGILGLNGTVTGLSSDPASRAKVKLEGKVDKYAPVDIGGEVNVLAAAKYTDLAMNFRNMELTTFNPYSGKFAGYNISKGKLSTELKYKVENRKLDAQHHIIVDNLEFGDKTDSKDAAPIPIKLAVALLKDRNGVIDVNLPVTGTLDDPKFRLGPIIWKAVLGLLTKIVTAPFAALGALFGGGDELAFVDFQPGSAELSATEASKLSSLAKALLERPQLRLDIPVTLVEKSDAEAIARQAYATQIPPMSTDVPANDATKAKRVAQLEGTYKTLANSAPVYPADAPPTDVDARIAYLENAVLGRLKPDANALDTLARNRARAVQDALLANSGLSPDRVFITTERAGTLANEDAVRMEMKLE